MGLLLDTNDAGDIAVEVRKESFYLTSDSFFLYEHPEKGGTVEIEFKDIKKVRAALDAVELHISRTNKSPLFRYINNMGTKND